MLAYLFKTNQRKKKTTKSKGFKGISDGKQPARTTSITAPAEVLVLIDEAGDLGNESGSSRAITMTASVNKNYPRLGKIARSYPKNTRMEGPDELKHHTSSDDVRRGVLKDFMRTAPQIYSVILKKSNFGRMTQKKAYLRMVEEVLDDIMEDPNVRACTVKV